MENQSDQVIEVAGESGVPEGNLDQDAAMLEALLFAAGEPLTPFRLNEICKVGESRVLAALERLAAKHSESLSGLELVEVAGKFQLRTKVEFGPIVRELKASRPRRLSTAALETLAIIAYRQPIVRADIEQIRGVDVSPTLKTLLERGLIRIVGHQSTVGQPALFGTTEAFLSLFGLRSLTELPTLRDIKEFEAEPGDLEDRSDDLAPASDSLAEKVDSEASQPDA